MPTYRVRFSDEYGAFPSQREFVRLLHDRSLFAVGFIAGFGAGKTISAGIAAIVACARNPGLAGMLVSPTYPMMRDTLLPTLLQLLELAEIPYEQHKSRNAIRLLPFDSEIWLRSGDNPDRLRGPNIAWCGLDEADSMVERTWMTAISRVRHPQAKHKMRWVTTTPEGYNWVYDYFGQQKAGYAMVNAKTTDNPTLGPEYVEQLMAAMDEQHVKAYIEGRFVPLVQKQCYYNFDRALHMSDGIEYDPRLPLVWSHDFNVNPMCSVIMQFPRPGFCNVIDEIVIPSSSTPEVAREFIARYGEHRGRVIISGDPSGTKRDTRQESRRSDFDIIVSDIEHEMAGAIVETDVAHAYPAQRRRINTVNAVLKNARGEVSLRVAKRCAATMTSLERTVHKDGSAQIDKDTEWKWGRHTFHGVEHITDALGYYLCRVFPDPAEIRRAA